MRTLLKAGAVAVALLIPALLFIRQQRQIEQLREEAAGLRRQLDQAASFDDENQRLAGLLKEAADGSQAERNELMRLRAQASRLRQVEEENARLKHERELLASRAAQTSTEAAPPGTATPTPAPDPKALAPFSKVADLGVVELTDRVPAQLDLGDGRSYVLTPTVLPDGNIQVEITVEVEIAEGKSEQLAKSRLTARPGQQCSVSAGDNLMITLTPRLKTE
jgi:hypothetical protein